MICKITPSRRAADAEWLSSLVAASSVKPIEVAGFTGVQPMPPRSARIDPETVLHRRQILSSADRKRLRAMTEQL